MWPSLRRQVDSSLPEAGRRKPGKPSQAQDAGSDEERGLTGVDLLCLGKVADSSEVHRPEALADSDVGCTAAV
jgi:hypothetical protein